jgi:hypothetical protein
MKNYSKAKRTRFLHAHRSTNGRVTIEWAQADVQYGFHVIAGGATASDGGFLI